MQVMSRPLPSSLPNPEHSSRRQGRRRRGQGSSGVPPAYPQVRALRRRVFPLPARHYEVLEAVGRWYDRLDVVERARAKPAAERAPADFGDLTWLRHLDDDDLAQFLQEVRAAVSVAYHDDDLGELEQLVHDWRATADELADPARRKVLLGGFDAADYVEAPRPATRP
jgi:hypothetical protein